MISLICGNFRGKCGEKAKIFSYFFVKTEKGINLSEQTFYISLGRFRQENKTPVMGNPITGVEIIETSPKSRSDIPHRIGQCW